MIPLDVSNHDETGKSMTNETGIYAIENTVTGFTYVGATKSAFRVRWDTHLSSIVRGTHHNAGIRRDAKRYGRESFRFVVLQQLPTSVPFAPFEQFWIDYLSSMCGCYNSTPAFEYPQHPKRTAPRPSLFPYKIFIPEEVATQLNVDILTVLRWLKTGTLVGFRVGRFWRVTEPDLVQFMLCKTGASHDRI